MHPFSEDDEAENSPDEKEMKRRKGKMRLGAMGISMHAYPLNL